MQFARPKLLVVLTIMSQSHGFRFWVVDIFFFFKERLLNCCRYLYYKSVSRYKHWPIIKGFPNLFSLSLEMLMCG